MDKTGVGDLKEWHRLGNLSLVAVGAWLLALGFNVFLHQRASGVSKPRSISLAVVLMSIACVAFSVLGPLISFAIPLGSCVWFS